MHLLVWLVGSLAVALILSSRASAQVQTVPYPEVQVNVSEAFRPDAAFEKMRAAFVEATSNKNAERLLTLLGPTFVWTEGLIPSEKFDMGRDASHNFKVAFGFRGFDRNEDGGVDGGPYWDALAAFASETLFYEVVGIRNLVCGPLAAEIDDDGLFERARKTIETGVATAHWYFTTSGLAVARAPGDTGPAVANLGTVALPVLKAHPSDAGATHFQVLLPSGETGWVPASAVRPLFSDRLCFARTRDGEWKIAGFEKSG